MAIGQNISKSSSLKIGWFYHLGDPGLILTSPRSARNPWHFARGLELAFPFAKGAERSSAVSNGVLWKLNETEDRISLCGFAMVY